MNKYELMSSTKGEVIRKYLMVLMRMTSMNRDIVDRLVSKNGLLNRDVVHLVYACKHMSDYIEEVENLVNDANH